MHCYENFLSNGDMRAIILAGGFGTRLSSQLGTLPKPMADIAGRPFLSFLLDYLLLQGVREVWICLHYQAQAITAFFGAQYRDLTLHYVLEPSPLGTGGAIVHALRNIEGTEPVFVLNGDSLVMLEYAKMLQHHQNLQRKMTIATRNVARTARYSLLEIHEHKISKFELLGGDYAGSINTGVYVIEPYLFDGFSLPNSFSFERDFLVPHTPTLLPGAFVTEGYFIDIGVPEDYARAQVEVPECFSRMIL